MLRFCTHTHTHTHIYNHAMILHVIGDGACLVDLLLSVFDHEVRTCTRVCMHVWVGGCVCVCVSVHVCMYFMISFFKSIMHICICMRTCMCACVHIYKIYDG